MMELISECILFNEEQLISLGKHFSFLLQGDEIIALNGTLGSGKTTFTKGVARALNIPEEIISPTFVLLREYLQGQKALYHYDLYRLEQASELRDLGFAENLDLPGIKIVEWADKFPNTQSLYNWMLYFSIPRPNQRKIQVYYCG